MLRKSRPWRGPLFVGQRVAYFRQRNQLDGEGTAEGYRQGMIIGLDPGPTGSVWIRNNRGRTVQVAREQVRGVEGEELWTPSSDDLRMLRTAEQDLSKKHAQGYAQPEQAPRLIEDRLILDASGQPQQAAIQAPPPVLALMPPPVSDLEYNFAAAEPAAAAAEAEAAPPATRTLELAALATSRKRPAAVTFAPIPEEDDVDFDARPSQAPRAMPQASNAPQEHTPSWFLDPDGRHTMVLENAQTLQAPPPDLHQTGQCRYRTSWAYHDNNWSKLEDRVDWQHLTEPQQALPHTMDRLVTSFGPDQFKGRRPSIESAPGMKRTAEESNLPGRADGSRRRPSATEQTPTATAEQTLTTPAEPTAPAAASTTAHDTSASTPPDAETPAAPEDTVNNALVTYCRSCGSKDTTTDAAEQTCCVRCLSHEFVTEPHLVNSWFDELEQITAMKTTPSLAHYHTKCKTWVPAHLKDLEEITLPHTHELDDLYRTQSHLMGIGQTHRGLSQHVWHSTGTPWSIAVKTDDWQWLQVFQPGNQTSHNLRSFLPLTQQQAKAARQQTPRLSRREQRWLTRHGRHCTWLLGWDGNPPELPPLFQQEDFSKAYLNFVQDISNGSTTSADPQALQDAQQHTMHGRPTWAQQHWQAYTTASHFNKGNKPAHEVITGPDSSSDDEELQADESGGRAAKQAMKREVPWRAIAKKDVPAFIKAMQDEWSEWTKWSSCVAIWPKKGEIDEHLILKSRVCYRWKPKDGGTSFKAKARVVVLGFQDPRLPLLSRDSPVLAKTSLHLIIQWAACYQVSLANADCKSAFLQGEPDDERPACIYMKPPNDGVSKEAIPEWQDPQLLYRLTAPVYGQANAPRRWFLHVLKVLTDLKWRQHSLDPCLFIQDDGAQVTALLGVHVDDIVTCCVKGFEFFWSRSKRLLCGDLNGSMTVSFLWVERFRGNLTEATRSIRPITWPSSIRQRSPKSSLQIGVHSSRSFALESEVCNG